eukprot:Amastigsp_a676538_222.p3 type:complete len:137 gc:universal Amastigsp_a676538_222:439-29(-)
MNFLVLVQIHETAERVADNGRDLVFFERPLASAHQISDTPAAAVLHDDPELVVAHIVAVVIHDVLVRELLHDVDLENHVLEPLLHGNLFDGNNFSRANVHRFEDRAVGTLAELFQELENLVRVLGQLCRRKNKVRH